jgi:hypothetical protein
LGAEDTRFDSGVPDSVDGQQNEGIVMRIVGDYRDTVLVTRRFAVEDVEPMDGNSWQKAQMMPTSVEIRMYGNGQNPGVTVHGFRMKADGTPSKATVRREMFSFMTEEWPDWLQEQVREAMNFWPDTRVGTLYLEPSKP